MLRFFDTMLARMALSGLAALALGACQTANADLNAGPGGSATPIIVSTTLPASFDDGSAVRIGNSHYFYLNGGSDGEKAARLGVGLAFGVLGVAANMAVVRANSTREAKDLIAPLSQPAAGLSYARIAAALPNAKLEPLDGELPARSIVLYPSVLLEETNGTISAIARLNGIQTDGAGKHTHLASRARPIKVALSRADVVAGRVTPDFLDAIHVGLITISREMALGIAAAPVPATQTAAPAAPMNVARPGLRRPCQTARQCAME